MKRSHSALLIFFIIVLALLTGCSAANTTNSSADWAFSFVVWDDFIYQISDEYVMEVDEVIGEVTIFSDSEGSYSGNFSNEYEEGTEYYSITGVSTKEAIAIEEDGRYRKAIRDGKYEGE